VIGLVGVGRQSQSQDPDTYETFTTVQAMVHPQFNNYTLNFDFGLIQLDGTSTQQFIKLNSDAQVPVDEQEVTVTGFGDMDPSLGTDYADTLQEVTVNVIANSRCEKIKGAKGLSLYGLIDEEVLCAIDSGEDACQGDSGGPLVLMGNTPERDVQVGIVSWGLGCADATVPGIYARLSAGFPWIRANLCLYSVDPPSYLNCSDFDSTTFGTFEATPSPISAPEPDNPILMTLVLQFDRYPADSGMCHLYI
jgi:trypsin